MEGPLRLAKWEQFPIKPAAEQLNRKYFNGELDLDFPMNYHSLLRYYAMVRGKVLPNDEAWVTELQVSNRYKMDEQLFMEILGHELIHVKMIQIGFPFEAHGKNFKRERGRLQHLGLNVPEKEDVQSLELDPGKAFRQLVWLVVILGWKPKPMGIAFRRMNQEALANFNAVLAYNAQKLGKELIVQFYQTYNPAIRKLKIHHELPRIPKRLFSIEPDLLKALRFDLVSTNTVKG